MKRFLFALFVVMQSLVAGQALAAPCVTGSFASYQALGVGGCTIGNLSFGSFGLLQEPTGANPFIGLTLAPTTTASQAGFSFSVLPAAVMAGSLFENLISYRVTGVSATIASASIALGTAGSSGDGAVSLVQNLCIAGLFLGADGVSGCSGMPLDQIILNIGGASDPPSTVAFAGTASLAVVSDIALDGGSAGSAALTSATNLFASRAIAAVPEPAPIVLLAAGLLAGVGYRRSRRAA